jgi:hypothetical protein
MLPPQLLLLLKPAEENSRMDPRLKIIRKGNPMEELSLLVRLTSPHQLPPRVKVMAHFGDIISCRLLRANLDFVYKHQTTRSIKAPRVVPANELWEGEPENNDPVAEPIVAPRMSNDDANVVFGIIDFGFDFTHADLQEDGQTCFEKIWLQGQHNDNNRYGYGRVVDRNQINHALRSPQPFQKLNYHPGRSDLFGQGMHGTHVLGIACGNGTVGRRGFAYGAPVIAVDMAATPSNGSDVSLGDSVKLVEALDFIVREAGNRPLVINMSLGGHGDAHTGQTLVELAIDNLLTQRPGTAVVQSTGNYYDAKSHAHGRLKQDQRIELPWLFKKGDRTHNEIEIWYEDEDLIDIEILDQYGNTVARSNEQDEVVIKKRGKDIGVILHRKKEPNTGKSQYNILTNGQLDVSRWRIVLIGRKIENGVFHAYVERDDRGQSIFGPNVVTQTHTTNSICNGLYSITVGAYNQDEEERPVLPFSSSGPTADGRMKPEIIAPGHQVKAARSAGMRDTHASNELCAKSGSSMAAPYVASALVPLLRREPQLTIHQLREKLFRCCVPVNHGEDLNLVFRTGHGYFNPNILFNPLLNN